MTKNLEELCQVELITKIKVPLESISKEFKKGYSVLVNDLSIENRRVVYSDLSYFSPDNSPEEKTLSFLIQKEDILIFLKQKRLQIGINVGEPFYFNKTSFIRIKCLSNLTIPWFINYLLEHKKEELEYLLNSSIDQNFCEQLKKMKLVVPDVREQQGIFEFLKKFDKLLDCLRETYELRKQQFQLLQEKLFERDNFEFSNCSN